VDSGGSGVLASRAGSEKARSTQVRHNLGEEGRGHSTFVSALGVVTLAFLAHSASAQRGRVVVDTMSSGSLANLLEAPARARISVYLPPSYASAPTRRYPVIYLLHGFASADTEWTNAASDRGMGGRDIRGMIDSLVAARAIQEMIVVMPNASNRFGGSFYVNSYTTGNWEDFIAHDLVAYVDSRYRTLARPESRGIAGVSMGGFGALYHGMRHGGATFGALYAMSACCTSPLPVNPAPLFDAAWDTLASLRSFAALSRSSGLVRVLAAEAAAFAPDSSKPPLFFSVRQQRHNGVVTVNPAAAKEWDSHIPLLMVSPYRANLLRMRAVQFDVGAQDEAVPPVDLMRLDTALTRAGIPHTFALFEGTHTSRITERLATRLLPFFSRALVFTR
jgi:S-formylglutathione hydrolase